MTRKEMAPENSQGARMMDWQWGSLEEGSRMEGLQQEHVLRHVKLDCVICCLPSVVYSSKQGLCCFQEDDLIECCCWDEITEARTMAEMGGRLCTLGHRQ